MLNFIFILSLGECSIVEAQKITTNYIDSAIAEINQYKKDIDIVSKYNDLSWTILKSSSPEHAEELYKYWLTKNTPDLGKINLYKGYASALNSQGLIDESITYKLKGLELCKEINYTKGEIIFNITLSNSYLSKKQPQKALEYLNKAEESAISNNIKETLWDVHLRKGSLYEMLNDTKKASFHLNKSWDYILEEESNMESGMHRNKGYALFSFVDFYSKYNFPVELSKYTELLAVYYSKKYINKVPPGHISIRNLFEKNSDVTSIKQFEKNYRTADSLKNINTLVYCSLNLARLFLLKDNAKEAIKYLSHTEQKLLPNENAQHLKEIYKSLVESHIANSNYQKAYDYKLKEYDLYKTITSEKMQASIAELEVKFETEKKDKEIANQQLELEQKKSHFNLSLTGGLLVLITGIGFIIYYKQHQKLKTKEIESLKTQQELVRLEALINGEEKERKRIAQDLHDGINGDLSVIKFKITSIDLDKFDSNDNSEFNTAVNMLDNAIDQIRHISHNLTPPSLQNFKLVDTIKQHCTKLESSNDINIDFQNYGNFPSLSEDHEIAIFRIIQEALNNTIKHAKASEVLVQINAHDDTIDLIVEDNGIGFNPKKNTDGIGLKNIKSRSEFLKAKLQIDSNNNGTTITININLKQLNND